MLFSKLKSKEEELLPPPPPFPSMELEEEKESVSSETKPKKAKDKDFEDLFKEVESLKSKKELTTKKPKKIELKQLKKVLVKKAPIKKMTAVKQLKEKKLPVKKITLPKIKVKKALPLKKLKAEKIIKKLPKLTSVKPKKEKLEDIDFILPKEEVSEKEFELPDELKQEEIELPDTFEEVDIDKELGTGMEDFGKDEETAKPREIMEAEDEIKSAIEKIKERNASELVRTRSQLSEKPSLFKRLFAKKEKTEEIPEEHFMPEIAAVDDISKIQNNINRAREALMRFDLETAKMSYIEVMKLYNRIKPEEQAKVYHDIRDLYFERKSAEELKV